MLQLVADGLIIGAVIALGAIGVAEEVQRRAADGDRVEREAAGRQVAVEGLDDLARRHGICISDTQLEAGSGFVPKGFPRRCGNMTGVAPGPRTVRSR